MKSQFSVAAAASLLVSIGAALPTLPLTYPQLRVRNASDTDGALAERIAHVSSETKVCPGEFPECRTNEELAPHLSKALQQYGITNPNAIAAVIALTAFESVKYRYKHNVSLGTPGQGTSNMQSVTYNTMYAMEFPELHKAINDIGITPENADAATPEQKNQLLELVKPDQYNFGSGPWFMRTQCPDVHDQFIDDADAGWNAYMACVGVPNPNEKGRPELWARAKVAMNN